MPTLVPIYLVYSCLLTTGKSRLSSAVTPELEGPEKKLFQIKSSEESKVKMTVIQVKRCIIEMVNLYKQAEVWIFNDRNDYSNVTLVLEDEQVQAPTFIFMICNIFFIQ